MKSSIALAFLFAALAQTVPDIQKTRLAHAQEGSSAATLRIGGAVSTPLVLSADDLKNMPRKKLSVLNPHENKTEVYEGVLVEDLLKKAGVPQGEGLRGAALPPEVGPLRVVAPHEKRPARWVRMLKSITVVRAATP